MFTDAQREKLIAFARERVSGNDSFHDMEHVMRTADTTVLLSIPERADRDVCWAAAMLHDICKRSQGDHAAEGARLAEKFLLEIGMDKAFAGRVQDAIHFHNKDFGTDTPIERQVLWDSDKLFIMTPEGFRMRMLPYWVMKKGRKAGIETAIYEYGFYGARFHTRTARDEIKKYSGEMGQYLKELGSEL